MRRFSMLFAICALAYSAIADAADDKKIDNPHLWRPKTKSVAVFKNGFGFFMREADVVGRDGWAVAQEIPPAAFGTLAIYATDEHQLVDVVGSGPGEVVEFDDVDAPSDNAKKRERLSAAKNMNVQLTYKYKDADRTAAGKLVSIGPEFVVLDTDGNSAAVPVEGISKMQILELPLRVHVSADDEKPVEKTTLGMAYLRQGITWIPEYSLKVLDDTSAELTLRGTLVNEAEDLVHADVNFVVGVPHFLHTEYLAPIAVGQVIRTIGAAVAPSEVRSQIMSRAAIGNNAIRANQFDAANPGVVEQPVNPAAGDLQGKIGNLPQLDGPGGSDYTVYTKNDLTLRRGERAIVTLFVRKIKYSHIYRWSPPAIMEHSLVLQNDTDTAWTTGPCIGISGGRPLSEDLLKYTPRGGKSELPVSAAINISHEKTEAESDRKFKAHSPADKVFYDLVTLSGELKLRNFEATNAEVVVTTSVAGKPIEASDEGKMSSDATKLQLLERAGAIEWRVTLKPKETKTLKYKYERYVPAN
jgi:hypothetical protein